MKLYRFSDTDTSGQCEYDIAGDAYRELIRTCYRYCRSVSFLHIKNSQHPNVIIRELTPYTEAISYHAKEFYGQYNSLIMSGEAEIVQYLLCQESRDILINRVNSIFSWSEYDLSHNLDDPLFIREDGSIFFFSQIHEGVCVLVPRLGEDISTILSQNKWTSLECPDVYAAFSVNWGRYEV